MQHHLKQVHGIDGLPSQEHLSSARDRLARPSEAAAPISCRGGHDAWRQARRWRCYIRARETSVQTNRQTGSTRRIITDDRNARFVFTRLRRISVQTAAYAPAITG